MLDGSNNKGGHTQIPISAFDVRCDRVNQDTKGNNVNIWQKQIEKKNETAGAQFNTTLTQSDGKRRRKAPSSRISSGGSKNQLNLNPFQRSTNWPNTTVPVHQGTKKTSICCSTADSSVS